MEKVPRTIDLDNSAHHNTAPDFGAFQRNFEARLAQQFAGVAPKQSLLLMGDMRRPRL